MGVNEDSKNQKLLAILEGRENMGHRSCSLLISQHCGGQVTRKQCSRACHGPTLCRPKEGGGGRSAGGGEVPN